MTRRDLAIAVGVALLWGLSFIVVKWGLSDMPPLMFAALRFGTVAVLAPLFPRPNIPRRELLAYGALWGTVQFAGLFLALGLGLPAGVASVVAQSQVLFTAVFATALGLERPSARHAAVGALAIAGLAVVGLARSRTGVPALGFLAALMGAAGWGGGNVLARRFVARRVRVDAMGFLAWASIVPAVSLAALSLALEGPEAVAHAAPRLLSWRSGAALAYQSAGSLVAGARAWNYLLRRYPPTTVAPFGLLVPVAGIAGGWLAFGERIGALQAVGVSLLFAGVAVNATAGWTLARPAAALAPRS